MRLSQKISEKFREMRIPTDAVMIKAVEDGDYKRVKRLLERGADPNASVGNAVTALHIAVAQENFPLSSLLLEHGADINYRSFIHSRTPLEIAVFDLEDLRMAKFLLEQEALLDDRRFGEKTLLEKMVTSAVWIPKFLGAIDLLVAHGAACDAALLEKAKPWYKTYLEAALKNHGREIEQKSPPRLKERPALKL